MMKAMPPTVGHENLIDFAARFADHVTVLIDTAADEPMVHERIQALWDMAGKWRKDGFMVDVRHIMVEEQNPTAPGFWDAWAKQLHAFDKYDLVIGSESYCFEVAKIIGARYIPYDPQRSLTQAKAEWIRTYPEDNFSLIASGFQKYVKTTVTIFGAESNGKTTLSGLLATALNGHWTFEWARPYLETVGPDITVQAMEDIWHGQYAVERQADEWLNKPYVVRDTDLYSTIGYWEQPHWADTLGPVPEELKVDAKENQADLYIILRSNIPFEEDEIRYGGDHRESPDEYWIALAEKYNLPYVVLDQSDLGERLTAAVEHARLAFASKGKGLYEFDRHGF
jgi:NadR type nicotinamide-nucleotide adenylyltransferase